MGWLRLLICFVFGFISCGSQAAATEDPNPPTLHSTSGAWPISRQWTPEETHHYATWIEHVYMVKTKGTVEQRIGKLERVLTDPEMNLLEDPAFLGEGSNPQLPTETIRAMNSLMDCGKFTAFMPAYYAYRRALPWMTAVVRSGQGDIRTSPFNTPVGAANSFTAGSVGQFFGNAVGSFISGNYRVNLDGPNAEQSDTVPVALNRQFLIPGCINYIDGHCLILASVSDYGELRFINCSTTPTRDIFTYNGMNTVSGIPPRGEDPSNPWAGCFQGLRVLRYPIAETDANGRVTRVRRRTNEEMKPFGFSTEQYDAIREIYTHQFIVEGELKPKSFHDFLRLRMKSVDTIVPVRFMEECADELLEAYVLREQFVQDAWREVRAHGPITYPENRSNENIFQALGRWETWSSPSSDVDRRNKYFYLADWMEYALRLYELVPASLDKTGLERYTIQSQSDLAVALLAEKNRIFAERSMEYTNSVGNKVRLSLLDIEQRLYDLSFDPNHPPELRWGAPEGSEGSEERASAPETWTPTPGGRKIARDDAYRRQAYYRVLGQRETDASYLSDMFTTGFPVRDKLDAQVGKWGPTHPPVVSATNEVKAVEAPTAQTPHARPLIEASEQPSEAPGPPARKTYRGLAVRAQGNVPDTQTVSTMAHRDIEERRNTARTRARIGRYR